MQQVLRFRKVLEDGIFFPMMLSFLYGLEPTQVSDQFPVLLQILCWLTNIKDRGVLHSWLILVHLSCSQAHSTSIGSQDIHHLFCLQGHPSFIQPVLCHPSGFSFQLIDKFSCQF